ncbi:MAG: hypothetical protein WC969_07165 [Elusimicrobiota bacterium]|jgi:hypothetical protein
MRELKLPLERTLRRYGIVDILPTENSVAPTRQTAFQLHVACTHKESNIGSRVVSTFSFAVVPGTWRDDDVYDFQLVAPNGDEKRLSYSYSTRTYSWLPFALFGPRVIFVLVDGGDQYQEQRLLLMEQIASRMINDATPFLLTHKGHP